MEVRSDPIALVDVGVSHESSEVKQRLGSRGPVESENAGRTLKSREPKFVVGAFREPAAVDARFPPRL
jgi:hypothetical protein